MAEFPQFTQDEEEYWRTSKEFVRVLIAELNRSLKESGVWKAKRKQICTTFAFRFANYLDQQWMKVDGKTQYPFLCFTKSFLDVDVSLAEVSPINCPHKSVELHAMVSDEVDWFFNEMKERENAVVVGSVGDETEDSDVIKQNIVVPVATCPTCQGTGKCYCIRKGSGVPSECPRCQGTGQCKHCKGTGKWIHA
ncbi:MAG: hypothetical protein R3C12_04145 [Planctomycetaceae bacterium]|nr:hypothetical protein [Planctomycetaceae bacterium]